MNKCDFDLVVGKLENYKYSSMRYIEYESVKDFELITCDEDMIVLYGRNAEEEMNELHWAVNEKQALLDKIKALGGNILVTFVPVDWKVDFLKNNFVEYSLLQDYWIDPLSATDKPDYDFVKESEYKAAADVTTACRWQSRGFHGETPEWIALWVSGADPNAKNSGATDCAVIVHREKEKVVGIVCTAVYGHESKKGSVAWIREIAVRPEYQGQGIGKKLLSQALAYGAGHGAKRAFLMADELNANAIKLYEKMGFVRLPGECQINMLYKED